MKNVTAAMSAILLSICLLQGCSSKSKQALAQTVSATSPDPQPTQSSEQTIKVPAIEAANLRIEEVRMTADSKLLTTTGRIGFNEDRITHVVAPMTGYLLELKARVGDQVKEGQPIAVIKSKDLAEAIADLLLSNKDLELAQKNHAMTKDLYEHDAASRIAFQQAENDLAKAKMQVTRNTDRLRLMGLSEQEISDSSSKPLQPHVVIKSPIDGVVTERQATPAQYVAADGTPLFTIADLSTVWVLGDVFERDMRLLRPNQRALVVTPAFPNHAFSGRISRIDSVLDPASRTVKVRCIINNERGQLRPEMFATVNFLLEESAETIDIPAAAVLTESGSSFVYLARDETTFVRQKIDVQPDGPGRMRLIAGLRVGDHIVTDGAILVRAEEEKKGDN